MDPFELETWLVPSLVTVGYSHHFQNRVVCCYCMCTTIHHAPSWSNPNKKGPCPPIGPNGTNFYGPRTKIFSSNRQGRQTII